MNMKIDDQKIRDAAKKLMFAYKGALMDGSLETATAYVLAKSSGDPSVVTATLEGFVRTAKLNSEAAEAVSNILHSSWDSVLKCKEMFDDGEETAAIMNAAVIYCDLYFDFYFLAPTPASLAKLAGRLLDIGENDKVLDICSGIGAFPAYALNGVRFADYTGIDIYHKAKDIAVLRADLLGNNFSFVSDDAETYAYPNSYDKIFAHPPFGLRSSKFRDELAEYFGFDRDKIRNCTSEWLFIALIIKNLKAGGRAVAITINKPAQIISDSFLREFFVKKGCIETVINLAPKLLYPHTAASVSIFVFSSGNSSPKLVDAEELYSKSKYDGAMRELSDSDIDEILDRLENIGTDSEYAVMPSQEDLEKEAYNLMASHYINRSITTLGLALSEIIRGSQMKAEELNKYKSDEPTRYRYISLSNIVDGTVEIEEGAQYLSAQLPDALKRYLIPNNAIVLSKMASPTFRSAVVHSDNGSSYVATSNLYIIKLRDEYEPFFVQAFLESPEGCAELEFVSGGTSVKTISVESLRNVRIPRLPLYEQKEIAKAYLAAQEEYNVLKRILKATLKRRSLLFEGKLGEYTRKRDASKNGQ